MVRKERAHISWGEIDQEVCAIGAPVLGHDGRALGSLVLSAPQARHDMAWAVWMKPLVREAADKASRNLRLWKTFPGRKCTMPARLSGGQQWLQKRGAEPGMSYSDTDTGQDINDRTRL